MEKLAGLSAGFCLLFSGLGFVAAQENAGGVTPPPKVLVIQREFLKPGKSGSLHEKTESAFVHAMAAAKWPQHYLGMDSLSGPSRALFIVPYDSFAAWEKDNLDTEKNATLSAALDRASIADGELLTEYDSNAFVYREDYSLNAPVNIGQMRYFEISRFKVRPGHEKEWDDLVKIYLSGYKSVPNAHWATFESMYGADNGGVYIVINPMKSLAEVDQNLADSKKFMDSLGESGMKRLGELSASCVESTQTNLYHFNPKMSYPTDAWVKADPTYWKPKVTAPAAKPAAAPAQ